MRRTLYRFSFTLVITLLAVPLLAQYKTYYVSLNGNDLNDGLSAGAPWKTISKVNTITFQQGDQVLFEGGQEFQGTIIPILATTVTGTSPVLYSSYGSGKAIINGGDNGGFYAYNAGGVEIHNMIFKGSGISSNTTSGIFFLMDTSVNVDHVVIDQVEAYGFREAGISIATNSDKGYSNVSITHSNAHDNGKAGISVYGNGDTYSHNNLYIGYCKAYGNTGIASITDYNTGSGIVISNVDQATIEYCESYENGQNNGHLSGGPVGIWTYNGKNVTIQYCESHHNKTGTDLDGGGFDLDGGSQNCIIQYCYSHDNEGPGYGMFEYGSSNTYTNNTIRYNISQNDGRKNNAAALSFWGVDDTHPIRDSRMFNNTVYIDTTGMVNGIPAGIGLTSPYISNTKIANNIIYTSGSAPMVNAPFAMDTTQLHFMYNDYFSASATSLFKWNGGTYNTLSDWQSAASGQEMDAGTAVGRALDPMMDSPGTGTTVHPADGGALSSVTGYHIKDNSPVIGAAMNIASSGGRDYYGTSLPTTSAPDMGAAQHITQDVLPVQFIYFKGATHRNYFALTWQVGQEDNLSGYEVQQSVNGVIFNTLSFISASGKSSYNFLVHEQATDQVFFYRIAATDKNGSLHYSSTIKHQPLQKEQIAVFTQGADVIARINSPESKTVFLTTVDMSGRVMTHMQVYVQRGENNIILPYSNQWPRGTYVLSVTGSTKTIVHFIK